MDWAPPDEAEGAVVGKRKRRCSSAMGERDAEQQEAALGLKGLGGIVRPQGLGGRVEAQVLGLGLGTSLPGGKVLLGGQLRVKPVRDGSKGLGEPGKPRREAGDKGRGLYMKKGWVPPNVL